MASEVFKPDGYYELLRRGPGHAAARSFERVMGDVLGPEADQPLYAAAAHERWYAAGDDARPGGPPRVCLVTSLASRHPSTPFRDPAGIAVCRATWCGRRRAFII